MSNETTQPITFERWLLHAHAISAAALAGTIDHIPWWRKQYDAGSSPLRAVIDNCDGAMPQWAIARANDRVAALTNLDTTRSTRIDRTSNPFVEFDDAETLADPSALEAAGQRCETCFTPEQRDDWLRHAILFDRIQMLLEDLMCARNVAIAKRRHARGRIRPHIVAGRLAVNRDELLQLDGVQADDVDALETYAHDDIVCRYAVQRLTALSGIDANPSLSRS